MLNGSEVASHCTSESLWIIIAGQVYDLTEFAPSHPGGARVLLKYAGKDATEEYDPIHPKGTIEALDKKFHLGPVDLKTVEKVLTKEVVTKTLGNFIPTLAGCLNLNDFEIAAELLLKPKAWSYYASAADSERTKHWNNEVYDLVRFRPRVLVDVENADLTTTILGHKSTSPFFISPAAMGRLAHPDGEKCLARVAAKAGIPYCVSANASVGFNELVIPEATNQTLFYQLYVNRDRSKTEDILGRVAEAGYKAICVTVDAPVAGKRERDERTTMDSESAADGSMRASVSAKQGIAQSLGSYVDAKLSWNDLAWIKVAAKGLPIIVKGIQTAEDAKLAAYYKVDAIICSNHGGRQVDGAPSGLEILEEIRLREPQVFKQIEVYVDGGIRRGTDVLKALCLGARAVGIGRPYMYSLVFGDEGVQALTTIMKDEIAQNMRLIGADRLSKLNPSMVNTRLLDARLTLDYKSPRTTFWPFSKL